MGLVDRGLRIQEERERRKKAGEPKMSFLEERAVGKSAPTVPQGSAWCRNCGQNVRLVRRVKPGKLVATGFLGFAFTKPTSCPICKDENVEPAHQ